jgi:hypothetical protein
VSQLAAEAEVPKPAAIISQDAVGWPSDVLCLFLVATSIVLVLLVEDLDIKKVGSG